MKLDKTVLKKLSMSEAVREAFRAGEEDEALKPMVKTGRTGKPKGRFQKGDSVIFYDIRGEREIELTQSLTDPNFSHFPAKKNLDLNFVTMIEYAASPYVRVAFAQEGKLKNGLAEVVSKAGLRLAKIAESEKAPHVGYFMNGKNEEAFPGEERFIVPSPHGFSYDAKPEMSANLVVRETQAKLKDPCFDLIIANLANVDVVGHIENKEAVIRAVETVDSALGRIVGESRKLGVTLIVTSDHGTVEEWTYPDGKINTGHTKNPVPFILADFSAADPSRLLLKKEGELADVAPAVLDLLGLEKPAEMTGQSVLATPSSAVRNKNQNRKILLLILDGWGMREEKQGNLIAEARTPNFDFIWARYPHALLKSSGEAVGMPANTVGNSEAGHLHLGAGRRVLLERAKIDKAIKDGSFFRNEAFLWAIAKAKKKRKALHLMGIVSHYSSHGTIGHLFALFRMAKEQGLKRVYIHLFIGRRGEKPESGAVYIEKVEETAKSLSVGEVVTVMGRFWSLDREGNWDRVEKAYRALVYGQGTKVCLFETGAK